MISNSINVCLVSPLPPPYGGIAHWGYLITGYAKNRSEVTLTVVDTAPRWRAIHDAGFLKRAVGGGFQMLRDMWRLLLALLFKQIDVVHLTTSGKLASVRDVGVLLLSLCFRVSLVYHIRFGRIPEISHKNTLEWRLMKFVALRAFSVIAIDAATGEALKKAISAAPVVVIPNCVDFSSLPKIESELTQEKIALFVGWVIPSKGIFELLESWSSIKPIGWKLKVVGPGDPDYIRSLKQKYGGGGVEFLGEQPHAAAMSFMAMCDVFVLPSYTEGFPNVILEAMALGKAIVATDVGAIREMLADGCGVFVKARDVDGLAIALKRLIEDKHQREVMGECARIRALSTYSIESVFATYVSIWRSAGSSPKFAVNK